MSESMPTKSYSSDPTLWLYTSLSSGSSQIVTATSRLETILKANRIPFKALDVATDEKARMLWGRRAGKRKLPGLVKMGMVVGDIDEIEEWNEYGELKEQLGTEVAQLPPPTATTNKTASTDPINAQPSAPAAPPLPTSQEIAAATAAAAEASSTSKSSRDAPTVTRSVSAISFAPEKSKSELAQSNAGGAQASMSMAIRQLGQEAAARANKNKSDSLAARKAQITAAEKLDSSATLDTGPPLTETKETVPSTTVETTTPHDTAISSAAVEEKDNAVSNATPEPVIEKQEAANPELPIAEESDTANGIVAERPESPLPVAGEAADAVSAEATQSTTVIQQPEFAVSNTLIPTSINDLQRPSNEITTHRGSSISTASKEEIKAVEEAMKISEEPEEDIDGSRVVTAGSEAKNMIELDKTPKSPTITGADDKSSEAQRPKSISSVEPSAGPKSNVAPEKSSIRSEEIASSGDFKDKTEPTVDITSSSGTSTSIVNAAAADPEMATESVKD